MRPVFVVSLASMFVSLLAILAFSAITLVPGPGVENARTAVITVAGVFAFAWFAVALWARRRENAALHSLPPNWLRRLLLGFGVAYALGVLLLAIG